MAFELFQMAAGLHLGFDPTGYGAVRSAVPENPTLEQTWKGSVDALQSYGHLKFPKMCEGAPSVSLTDLIPFRYERNVPRE